MKIQQARTGMHTRLGRWAWWSTVLLAMMALGSGSLQAANGSANTLESIDYTALGGNKVRIVLTMGGVAAQPTTFTTDNPARIALDFTDTTSRLAERSQSIGVGVIRSVSAVEAQGRTRVVINLAAAAPFETTVEGNEVIVVVGGAAGGRTTAASPYDPRVVRALSKSGAGMSAKRSVANVDFRRGEAGEARVLVELSDPNTVVDMREEAGKIVIDFQDTGVASELVRKLDVIDFATPVKQIETFPQGANVRMVITPIKAGEFEHFAYQADQLYTVELRPLSKEEVEARQAQKPSYTGERLSLNFQNIEIRAVLQLLADFTELNMVVSDTVTGNITLRLKNVPWDQALDIVLKSKGLDKRVVGNVMMVAPGAEILQQEQQEFARLQQVEDQAPLFTEIIQVNYAKASEVAQVLQEGASAAGDVQGESISGDSDAILSDRGSVAVDDRTNILIVKDTAVNLERVRDLVTRLDVPVRQVMIESRIVIATNEFAKDFGVKFGFNAESSVDNGGKFGYFGGNQPEDAVDSGDNIALPATTLGGLLVNLPAPAPSGTANFLIGKVGEYLLRLELSAMQTEGRGEVISNPRVVTAEKKEATITQGTQIPVRTVSAEGTNVSFQDATLELKVTPQITPDERIIMDLAVKKDLPDFSRSVDGIPPIDTRSVETSVQVANGETIVLGGIYEQTKSQAVEKVPFFGDLPGVGVLFRNNLTQDNKNELLIFVTPQILKEFQALR
jgi:type IV pilus assembly protein PilQ